MTFDQRARYMHKEPWKSLGYRCSDMWSDPRPATRTYRWAEEAWLNGYLSTQAFYLMARDLQTAIQSWDDEMEAVHRSYRRDIYSLVTSEEIAAEERRLRKQAWEGYFDRPAWAHLGQAMREYRERNEEWERRQLMAQETRRQRRFLREGHQTLTALRQLLSHGAAASPPPVSTPERTSPTL